MFLGLFIGFLAGFFLNWVFIHFAMKPLHDAYNSIENKYARMIAILQEWQKKI